MKNKREIYGFGLSALASLERDHREKKKRERKGRNKKKCPAYLGECAIKRQEGKRKQDREGRKVRQKKWKKRKKKNNGIVPLGKRNHKRGEETQPRSSGNRSGNSNPGKKTIELKEEEARNRDRGAFVAQRQIRGKKKGGKRSAR